jgi:hypothetical protein
MLSYLLFAQTARASDTEEVPIDIVPPEAVKAVNDSFPDAQVVSVSKVSYDGKEAYMMTIIFKGSEFDIMVRANGRFLGRREPALSGKDFPAMFSVFVGSLLPGCAGAIIMIRSVRRILHKESPAPIEWSQAWLGAVIALSVALILILQATKGGRPRDISVAFVQLAALGALSASIVEIGVHVIRYARGNRRVNRIWILTFCLFSLTFGAASVLVEANRRDNWNRQVTAHALDLPNAGGLR